MSVIEDSDPFAEWYGVDPWADVESSEEEIEYPEPLPYAGTVVSCPECGVKMSKNGFHTHWRRSCSPNPTER